MIPNFLFGVTTSNEISVPYLSVYEAAKTTSFTTGVTTSGTPGNSGAYTQIVVSDTTPSVLHYQCSAHGYMGNQVVIGTRNLTGLDTGDLGEGSNLYYTDARVLTKINATSIDALSDVDTTTSAPSSGQALKWSGSTWEPGDASSQVAARPRTQAGCHPTKNHPSVARRPRHAAN